MLFAPPRSTNRNREINLFLFGQKIKTVKEVHFLGTLFNQGLTWSNHIDKLLQKATPRSIQICRLARSLNGRNNRLLGQLINALILSIFDYSSVAWITAADTQWKKVNQSQMRTLKILLNVPRRTSDEAVLNRVNTGTYREIITTRATSRFESINRGNGTLTKFQSRCLDSDKTHNQSSAYELLTESADLLTTLTETKCIVCTYSPECNNFIVSNPNRTTFAPYTDQNGDKDPAVDCSKVCYNECGTDCNTVFREQIFRGPYILGSLKGVSLPPIKLA